MICPWSRLIGKQLAGIVLLPLTSQAQPLLPGRGQDVFPVLALSTKLNRLLPL